MADVVKTSSNLKIENYFVDGDTRTITLKNPKDTIEASAIEDLNTFMRTTGIIIGDKTGATFGKISKVTKVDKTQTDFDIN